MSQMQLFNQDMVRQAVSLALASGKQLQNVQHGIEVRERVYHRPNETVYETKTREITVFHFK